MALFDSEFLKRLEYLSLVVGYQWLLVIAGALYVLSLVGLKRLAVPAVISVRK